MPANEKDEQLKTNFVVSLKIATTLAHDENPDSNAKKEFKQLNQVIDKFIENYQSKSGNVLENTKQFAVPFSNQNEGAYPIKNLP